MSPALGHARSLFCRKRKLARWHTTQTNALVALDLRPRTGISWFNPDNRPGPTELVRVGDGKRLPLVESRGLPLLTVIPQLTPCQARLLEQYMIALIRFNKKVKMDSDDDRWEVLTMHIADSFALLPAVENAITDHSSFKYFKSKPMTMVDVGSGAGFPGLILGLVRRNWRVILMEPFKKRSDFLEEFVKASNLTNIVVIRSKAEKKAHLVEHREMYNVAVARSIGTLRRTVELCVPLLCVGGVLVVSEGPNAEEEIEKSKEYAEKFGATILHASTVVENGPLGVRTAVTCVKHHSTPACYPRYFPKHLKRISGK